MNSEQTLETAKGIQMLTKQVGVAFPENRCSRIVALMMLLLLPIGGMQRICQAQPDVLTSFANELVEITPGAGVYPVAPDGQNLPASFSISKYEVPQNLYMTVTGKNPSRWKGPRNSVEMVSAVEAQAFCEKLTRLLLEQELVSDEEIIRLPTEDEWEYCCRSGTTTAYSFGDEAQAPGDKSPRATVLDAYGWHTGNAAGNDPAVGTLKPNPWGLFDVHGYLWELATDPADPGKFVVRGGSWKDHFSQLTSASRKAIGPEVKDDAIGFRCVKTKLALKVNRLEAP